MGGAYGKEAPGGCAEPEAGSTGRRARTPLRATRHLNRSQSSQSPAPVRLRGETTGGDWLRGERGREVRGGKSVVLGARPPARDRVTEGAVREAVPRCVVLRPVSPKGEGSRRKKQTLRSGGCARPSLPACVRACARSRGLSAGA